MAGVRYVLGLQFTPSGGRVVLIKKRRPDWQAGYFNGVGGHIGLGETPVAAMRREFETEGKIACPTSFCLWKKHLPLGRCRLLTIQAEQVRTVTDEEVGLYTLPFDPDFGPIVYNVPPLISLALMD